MSTRVISLVGVNGTEINLCTKPFYASVGPALWGAPPPAVTATEAVGLPGSRFRQARWLARPMRIPVRLLADSAVEVERAINRLARMVDPTVGDVIIKVTRPDGVKRRISARYVGGMEGALIEEYDITRSNEFDLLFTAHDPFWRDDIEVEREILTVVSPLLDTDFDDPDINFDYNMAFDGHTYGTGTLGFDAAVAFDDAFTGFSGDASAVTTLTLTINGDVTSWPRWTIDGPADNISLINSTIGKRFSLTTSLAGGDQVIIETKPGERKVWLNGVEIWDDIEAGSAFWGLEPTKLQIISVGADNMVDGTSLVSIRWRERFLTC